MSMQRLAVAPWTERLLGLDDLAEGTRVVVGCSGGPDSLALLALARARDLDVVAVYVDHGLRAGTAHDARVVRAAAAAVGASARVIEVAVDARANLEARARDARYEALTQAAHDAGAAAVLVGHTRDDQAETVLLGLLRGSGLAGMAGMAVERGTLRRPLLALRRADTREICARLSFTPVHDPMNDELHHQRVWLRREVIPQLERGAARDLVEVLAREADVLREDNELLDALAAEHAADDAVTLSRLPRALARRVVRRWLGQPPPALSTVDAVLQVARGDRRAVEVPGGRRVERVGARLHLVDHAEATHTAPVAPVRIPLPGRARFGSVTVEAWIEAAPPVAWPDGERLSVVDADRVGSEAYVRLAYPAERFRPLGRGGSKLVRDALVDAGVPAGRRAGVPIVAAGPDAAVELDRALWIVGYRIDDRVRVTARTRRYLWLSVDPV
jgi:tRNA(Ile)-lysidine synthase